MSSPSRMPMRSGAMFFISVAPQGRHSAVSSRTSRVKARRLLVELDVSRLRKCGPARDLRAEVLTEVLRCHRPRLDGFAREFLGKVGRLQNCDLRFVEAAHDIGGHACGADRAV